MVGDHRSWVTCSISQSSGELDAQWCLVLPHGVCACSKMEAKPTSRKSECISTLPGLMWLKQKECDQRFPRVTHDPLAQPHKQRGHFSTSTACRDVVVRCKWEHSYPIVASPCCWPTCFSIWLLVGFAGLSPEAHMLNNTSCPFSLRVSGHYQRLLAFYP